MHMIIIEPVLRFMKAMKVCFYILLYRIYNDICWYELCGAS